MRSGKRFAIGILPIFLCMLSIFLAACGGSTGTGSTTTASNKASDDKQVFRFPVVGDISTFDPALVQDTDSNFPIQAVFTGLVQLDDQLNVQPQLAQSFDKSTDGLTYTFHLRANTKFSDGTPLTSADVAYSINRTLLPATKSPVAGYLSLLKDFDAITAGKIPTVIGDSVLVPDANTVVMKLSAPGAYFLKQLTYPTSYVVEKKIVEQYGATWTDHLTTGGGAGPWKVSNYSHTTGIELVPNDNYYGSKPQLKKLNFVFFPTDNAVGTMYKSYQAQQLDYTPIPPANVPDLIGTKEYHGAPRLTIRYLSMNYLAKPFDNIKIRQAFALSINKDEIVKTVLQNIYTPSNHVIPEGMPGYFPDLVGPDGQKTTSGNTDKAKQLLQEGLKEAGYSGADKLPPVSVAYNGTSTAFKNAVAAMQQMWKQTLGVSVTAQPVDRTKLLTLESASKNSAPPKGLQMWIAGWNADYSDPQDWLSVFFQKGSDYNQFNYGQNSSTNASVQQSVQDQLNKAYIEQNDTTRNQMYNKAEQQIVNDTGWVALWQEKLHRLIKPSVQGFVLNTVEIIPPNSWSKIYISQ